MTAKIEIRMDNAAFEDRPATELGRILRDLADNVEAGDFPNQISLRDLNGNRVGNFEILP